jgi:hypothetical protein
MVNLRRSVQFSILGFSIWFFLLLKHSVATDGGAIYAALRWSPNGEQIAYVVESGLFFPDCCDETNLRGGIYLSDKFGTNRRMLSKPGIFQRTI